MHRDPGRLNLLKEKGYGLITATNGSEGLRLLMSQSVDAIVIEYYLGLLNGAVVADEIKQVRLRLPTVMVADYLELPEGALKSWMLSWPNPTGLTSCWRRSTLYCKQRRPRNMTELAQNSLRRQ